MRPTPKGTGIASPQSVVGEYAYAGKSAEQAVETSQSLFELSHIILAEVNRIENSVSAIHSKLFTGPQPQLGNNQAAAPMPDSLLAKLNEAARALANIENMCESIHAGLGNS